MVMLYFITAGNFSVVTPCDLSVVTPTLPLLQTFTCGEPFHSSSLYLHFVSHFLRNLSDPNIFLRSSFLWVHQFFHIYFSFCKSLSFFKSFSCTLLTICCYLYVLLWCSRHSWTRVFLASLFPRNVSQKLFAPWCASRRVCPSPPAAYLGRAAPTPTLPGACCH